MTAQPTQKTIATTNNQSADTSERESSSNSRIVTMAPYEPNITNGAGWIVVNRKARQRKRNERKIRHVQVIEV